jgi:hypothetical protein
MARQRCAAGMESFEDLARKVKILERELAVQRVALDKLKQMGSAPRYQPEHVFAPIRKTA